MKTGWKDFFMGLGLTLAVYFVLSRLALNELKNGPYLALFVAILSSQVFYLTRKIDRLQRIVERGTSNSAGAA